MLRLILEAAFRSLLMAGAVWAVLRIFRTQAVIAQKVAWVLVLLAAGAMPLVMRVPWLALDRAGIAGIQALRIPIRPLPSVIRHRLSRTAAPQTMQFQAKAMALPVARTPKPSPSHRNDLPTARSSAAPELAMPESILLSATAAPAARVAETASEISFWNWSRIRLALTLLYFGVAILLLLRTLAGLSIAFRIWLRSRPVERDAIPALSETTAGIRLSRDLATPVTIGSTVILPSAFADWDEAKLRIVLAHEQSHVRQGDFYLQLLAAIHGAIFWFSPLGWWLQRKLSELGEALSDHAGLEQAPNPSTYAQILLEFAAAPRTSPLSNPLSGVAMARSSNVSSRIERILNARLFRLAFLGGRRHAILAATLVPAVLVAVVAGIRIVPAVEAAQSVAQTPGKVVVTSPSGMITGQVSSADSAEIRGEVTGQVSGQISADEPDQVMSIDSGQEAPPAPAVAPLAPNPPSSDIAPVTPPEPPAPHADMDVAPVPPIAPRAPRHRYSYSYGDDGQESFAIVHGNDSNTVNFNDDSRGELNRVRRTVHGNFIWFEHDGKSYVITDPALVAQGEALFKGDESLNRQMAILDQKQAELNQKMKLLEPEMAKASLPGPEFEAQMKKLQAELAELQSDKYQKLAEKLTAEAQKNAKLNAEEIQERVQEKLGELQEKIGDIQGEIGDIQGKIGERQGLIGEKQGELGEQMGRIGEQMGLIGEQQGRNAEEAARKLRSVLDQALRDGKAKPVE